MAAWNEAVGVTQDFEVTAEELVRSLQRRGVLLPSEIGAFVVLEVCEQLMQRPVRVTPRDIYITELGDVLCAQRLPPDTEFGAVGALLGILAQLLVCAAPGVPNMLLDLVEHGPNDDKLNLALLRSDLEACLLPLNRGATRRVLARLVREVHRDGPSGLEPDHEPVGDVDAAFDNLLGHSSAPPDVGASQAVASEQSVASGDGRGQDVSSGEPTTLPAPPAAERNEHGRALGEEVTVVVEPAPELASLEQPAADAEDTAPSRSLRSTARQAAAVPAPRRVRPRPRSAREIPTEAMTGRPKLPTDLDAMVETQAPRGRLGLWVFILSTAGAVAMLLAYFAFNRDQRQSALAFLQPAAPSEPASTRPRPPPRRLYGDLRANSQPEHAQVFLLIGPGPALATDIPLGVAQEFVAIADEYRPARALLPADAVWDDVDGRPRYELAIQARPLNGRRHRHSADDLGPTLLPDNVGTPLGRLGSVRVVTTPRAAQVYQLIGFTPDVHVDNLPLDHAYELLFYVEGRAPVHHRVELSDFKMLEGKRVAVVDVHLAQPKK